LNIFGREEWDRASAFCPDVILFVLIDARVGATQWIALGRCCD